MQLLLLPFLLLTAVVQAQLPPTPEFIDQPYLWERSSNQVLKLEEGTISVKMKVGKGFMNIAGGPSATTTTSGSGAFSFVMNMNNKEIPTGLELYALSVVKDHRALVIKGPESLEESKVPINFKKLDGDLYEIVPSKALVPGEYAFFLVMKSYSFKVH